MWVKDKIALVSPNKTTKRLLPAALTERTLSKRSSPEIEEPAHYDAGLPQTDTRFPIRFLSFLFVVVIPFIVATLYFGAWATNQYVAEAKFAVRTLSGETDGENLSGGILDMKSASQDTYVVTSFIQSPEIIRRIEENEPLRSLFSKDYVDFGSIFPSKNSNDSFFSYWKRHVTTYVDGPSGIITLRVSTFDPEDSTKIAGLVLKESEALINELSERARRDAVSNVKAEVDRAGESYLETLSKLNQFQKEKGLISPEVQARETGRLLTELLGQKLSLETRQFVARESDADQSPSFQQMTLQRESIEQQIAKLRTQLTGADGESVSVLLLHYAELETERIVAEKLYEASRDAYEKILAESARQTLYLSVFSPPMRPDEATYPRRFFTPFLTLIACLMAWATLSLVWASVEDHML